MPRISQLPALTTADGNDESAVVDTSASTTKKITKSDYLKDAATFLTPGSISTANLADGSATPAKRSGGFKLGIIPGATFGTTGNKTITGVGFTPKMVRFWLVPTSSAAAAQTAIGAADDTTQSAAATFSSSGTAGRESSTNRCIFWMSAANAIGMSTGFVSFNSDGFVLNVYAANSAFSVAYEAFA